MFNKLKIKNKEKGFTLVEIIVASFVFSIIVLGVSNIFTQILDNERRAFAAARIQENGLFFMELMVREIRVSQILSSDSDCGLTTLAIEHPVNGSVTYSLSNEVLQRTAGGVTTDISTSDVAFSRLNFCVLGADPLDTRQTRVAILASIQNKTGREIMTFNLETMVSTRDVQTKLEAQ